MKLIDFAIGILRAQAQTLTELSICLGESELIRRIEQAEAPTVEVELELAIWKIANVSPAQSQFTDNYQRIDSASKEIEISGNLEFNLWSYPLYRALIEDLTNFDVTVTSPDAVELLQRTLAYAESWLTNLSLPAEITEQTRILALAPWLKFRAGILRQAGHRPFAILSQPCLTSGS